MVLRENDWQAINNILLKMYSEKVGTLFSGGFMKQLKYLIPFDKASFYLHNHSDDSNILQHVSFEQIGFDSEKYQIFVPMIPDKVPHSWANFYERSIVIRDSDVIPDEEERLSNEYFGALMANENVKYGLTISLAHSNTRIGILTLFREKDKEDFSEREVKIAEQLMDHIACYAYDIYKFASMMPNSKSSQTVTGIITRYGISSREAEVLKLVLLGNTTKEICSLLSISETTTKKHLSSIYSKLGIHSKAEMFRILEIDPDK